MLKKYYLLIGLISLLCANLAIAKEEISLQTTREATVKEYIVALGKADYKTITALFAKNGEVISTSRGKVNAKEFFYAFLSNVVTAHTEAHQYFIHPADPNRVAARFHFDFKLKNGEEGAGEYIDEFVFTESSNQLSAVYMFENLKFQP